jgi:hypothetical protein
MGLPSNELAASAEKQRQQQQQRRRQERNARRHSVLGTTTEDNKTNNNSYISEESTVVKQQRRGTTTMIRVKITSSNPTKVPLAWLSGTEATKMAFDARQHASKSKVRFPADERIARTVGRSVYDLTHVDKDGLWYTKQEIMAITKENNELSKLTTRRRFHMDGNDDKINGDDDESKQEDEDCLRGLETLVSMRASLTKRFQRNAVRQAVLDEQRRQRIKGILDADLIRKLSRTHSKESRELALLMGKADAQELRQQENGRYHYSGGVGGVGAGGGAGGGGGTGGAGDHSKGRSRQHSTASTTSSSDDASIKTFSTCTSISSFDSEMSDLMRKKRAGLVISAKKTIPASSPSPNSMLGESRVEIPPMEMPVKTKRTKERKNNRMSSPVKRRPATATAADVVADDGITAMVRNSPSKTKRRSSLDSTISSYASKEEAVRLTNTPPMATRHSNTIMMEDQLDMGMGKLQCSRPPRVMAQQWLSAELCPINTGPCIKRYQHDQDHPLRSSSPQARETAQGTTTSTSKLVINHKRREMMLSPIKKKSSNKQTMTLSSSPSSSSDGYYQRREIVVD